jgi:hypothetical protein
MNTIHSAGRLTYSRPVDEENTVHIYRAADYGQPETLVAVLVMNWERSMLVEGPARRVRDRLGRHALLPQGGVMPEWLHVQKRDRRVTEALMRSLDAEKAASEALRRACDGGEMPPAPGPIDHYPGCELDGCEHGDRPCAWCGVPGCLSLHADDMWEPRAEAARYQPEGE